VRLIEPESEADPAALLANFLTAFGNAAGLNSYFVVESDRHYPRLFCALVGETSKGRKGTSWGHIKTLLEAADPEWVKRQVHGLSSGEGLIWSVHDPITKSEPIRDNKKLVTGYQEVITDPGIDDKRAFVLEGELASTLKVMSREGNTLSPVLRNAWDNGTLQALTKNSPAKATGAHISLVGHITKLELLRQLNETEAANGFGNRFLWICVRRSKCLPEGGNLKPEELERLSERVHEALQFAKREQKLWLTNDALEVWREVYPTLSEGQPGLLGAVTSRAESQVLRIALIYALLDKSPDITRDHLYAGLAVWDYAFSSAEYIFGKNIGNPIADKILRLLGNSPDGMTKTELSNAFKHNVNANLLNSAFSSLEQEKRIVTTRTDTGGAPSTRYFITGASTN
jgi:hypothetical protein